MAEKTVRRAARRGSASPGASGFEPHGRRAEALLLAMLKIAGPSGREKRIAEFIEKQLRLAGAPASAVRYDRTHRKSIHGGEIGNLICTLPGTRPGPRRLLMAHMDTVPLCVGAKPKVRGRIVSPAGKKTGLGADNRAGSAAVLTAALEILRRKLPHPPLTLLWTVQEEVGLAGARHVQLGRLGRPRLAFNFDGSSPEEITVGATGGYRMEILVHGVAAHAGVRPENGVSAITIAALAIADLQQNGWHGRVEKDGGWGTCNIGVIAGGDATNVVTPEVRLRAEARSHDSAFRRRIVDAVHEAFHRAAQAVRNVEGVCGSVEIEGRLDYESFRLPADDPSVAAAEAAVRAIGGQPVQVVSNGGLDANWMTERGIPTVTLGAGMKNVHTTAEFLDLDRFRQACRLALLLATGLTPPSGESAASGVAGGSDVIP